ncbi:MarR family transcriptional regulator [Blastococcus sp. TF02-8]|uniref:MarR family winged helix-turn-helix transcriptional regulator n=1 Tax=Blastococcus sp. TF02-8 TaxID=2250574 RepID=UPI000DE988B4|nr:MarR family winged helix-turn-helix transcriptional regulator [Blastococcus sp. TF02-8]RBY96086.1 MarR family transcriptional regulator [Blastococcus sp. TF02-8]
MSTESKEPCALNEDELDHCLERTHLVFRGVVDQADRLLAEHGLGRAHQRVLWVVARQPNLPIGTVSGFLGVSLQALHKTMRQLRERELVTTAADPANRRLRLVALTEAGRTLEARLSEPQRASFAAVAAQLGTTAMEQWGLVMDTLAVQLGVGKGAGDDDAPTEAAAVSW